MIPYSGNTPWEPYGGAVCTGMNGSAPVGYYVIQTGAVSLHAAFTTGWYTVGYA